MIAAARIRILGIDPGSVATGYGIIESDGRRNDYITHGTIHCAADSLAERLGLIYCKLEQVIQTWQPHEAAVEAVFVSRNAASALKLGQARGAALCVCINSRMIIQEYAARSVKQAVVGTGTAKKEQIQHMVKALLNLRGDLQADAADALAVAICHGHSRFSGTGVRLPVKRRRSRRR